MSAPTVEQDVALVARFRDPSGAARAAAFDADARLATWIYRVALRTALRLRARHSDLPSDDDAPPASIDPAPELAARDRVRRVETALAAVPAEQRTVMCLFAVDGLGHREIAEILGVPEGTVWSRLHQARKELAAVAA